MLNERSKGIMQKKKNYEIIIEMKFFFSLLDYSLHLMEEYNNYTKTTLYALKTINFTNYSLCGYRKVDWRGLKKNYTNFCAFFSLSLCISQFRANLIVCDMRF